MPQRNRQPPREDDEGNPLTALRDTLQRQIGESSRLIRQDLGSAAGAVGSAAGAARDALGNLSIVDTTQELSKSARRVGAGIRGEGEPTIGDVFNVASMGAAGGIGAARAGISGDLGMFGGMRAARNTKGLAANRLKAQRMEDAGRSPQEILETTGFSKGAEGRWKYEISDDSAFIKINAPENPSLGDILEHPRLYRHYPDMKDIPVEKFTPGVDGIPAESKAFYQPAWGNQPEKIGIYDGVGPVEAKSLLLHEGQHGIQFREGFAAGGEPTKAFFEKTARALIKREEKAGNQSKADDMKMRLEDFRKSPEQDQQLMIGLAYRILAGEIEASNVMTREGFTPSMRRQVLPQDTEDFPRKFQAVLTREELAEGLATHVLRIE